MLDHDILQEDENMGQVTACDTGQGHRLVKLTGVCPVKCGKRIHRFSPKPLAINNNENQTETLKRDNDYGVLTLHTHIVDFSATGLDDMIISAANS
ncbi:hypothetical protein ElyMa_005625100 [Elysia marginata]|uniref:Uncharacterized protein n=1 Tax=Elysia marginata TaxID=1093978 RepID=A0AAV4F8B3_9GAST|nr:hypothetical protein ElyMa_005625100 [Elysia marginata]